jgi:hypothetical protein
MSEGPLPERGRSTGRRDRRARRDSAAWWAICLCPREARSPKNGPPSSTSSPAPPARGGVFPARPAARGQGARGTPPTSAAGPGPDAERAPASRAELRRRASLRLRSSTQPRRHHPDRLAETPEPLEPPSTPDPRPSPASTATSPPASSSQLPPRVASGFTPSRLSDTHLLVPHLPAPPSLAAAPPEAPPASRLGWPVQVYLAGRGRGVRREAADPPSSLSPGGEPRKHPKAGRRPVALMEETHRAKQMEGNTRRETGADSRHGGPLARGASLRPDLYSSIPPSVS